MYRKPQTHETFPGAYGILAGLLVLFLAVLAATSGCAGHQYPQHRTPDDRERMSVSISTFCLLANPFEIGAVIYEGGRGTGVMIDDTHVLTAHHVVSCPTRPLVTVTTQDGREYNMLIEREWIANDVARLVMGKSGETFADNRGHIPRPFLALPPNMGEPVCAFTAIPKRGINCGPLVKNTDEDSGDLFIMGLAWHGNSGSGVYDSRGRLVGILVSGMFYNNGEPAGTFHATSIRSEYIRD